MSHHAPYRILFPFEGSEVGGSHVSAALLIQGLQHAGHEPLAVIHTDGPLTEYLAREDVPFRTLGRAALATPPALRTYARRVASDTAGLTQVLRHHAIDIVHTNDYHMHARWRLVAKLTRRPHVWHQRGAHVPGASRGVRWEPDAVVSISRTVTSTLPTPLRQRAVEVTNPFRPNPFRNDKTAAAAKVRTAYDLPANAYIVAFVANFRHHKRPHLVPEVASALGEESPRPTAFLLFGTDSDALAPVVTAAARRRCVESTIVLAGFSSAIEEQLAGADALIAPAVHEGFGRVVVEAMLAGTPVVAAAHGGHVEAIDDHVTGRLVAPDDPVAFADVLRAWQRDPASAQRLASQAFHDATARYSVDRHVSQIASAYQSLLTPDRQSARGGSWRRRPG